MNKTNSTLELNIPIPETINYLSDDNKILIIEYLKQLNEKEKIAYKIAFDHLGSSFNIIRSNGFQEWLKKK